MKIAAVIIMLHAGIIIGAFTVLVAGYAARSGLKMEPEIARGDEMDFKRVIAEIKKREHAVANERDKLNVLVDGLIEVRDDCEDALNDLRSARDALSRRL